LKGAKIMFEGGADGPTVITLDSVFPMATYIVLAVAILLVIVVSALTSIIVVNIMLKKKRNNKLAVLGNGNSEKQNVA
jgi:hypothetical protein